MENNVTRRDLLRHSALAGIGIGAALWGGTGCGAARDRFRAATGPTPPKWTPLPADANASQTALHVLNRVAYGPRPDEVARAAAMGVHSWIEEQLADTMDEDPAVDWRINSLDLHQLEQDAPDVLYALPDEQLIRETGQMVLIRAVYSRHQLRETLADFWTNHFNIYALKAEGQTLIPSDAQRVIRPHIFGKFRDLLTASAHSPAMLAYLDNQQNRRGVPNENYARELLELHTLGVHSGYTQADIQQVARCFTGWTVTEGMARGRFLYDANRHDDGAKHIPFLNLTIAPNGGQHDADTVLASLAAHPATARFLARKLCLKYLGDAPDALVEKAASAYLAGDTDVRKMLRPILLDGLTTPGVSKPILKRPLDFAVSALRVLAADTDGGTGVQQHLAAMGQPLYQWPMPDGFPSRAASWTSSLLPRWNYALALAANAIGNTSVDLTAPLAARKAASDDAKLDALIETVLSQPRNAPGAQATRAQIAGHIAKARRDAIDEPTILAEATGLLLASPAYQWT